MLPHALTHRFYVRSALIIIVCVSLLWMPGVPLFRTAASEVSQVQTQEHCSPRPKAGKPEGMLPDLREVENESAHERDAVAPIHSTMRSPKVPLRPWDGRRVGDPETRGGADAGGERVRTEQPRRAHARRRVKPPVELLVPLLGAEYDR